MNVMLASYANTHAQTLMLAREREFRCRLLHQVVSWQGTEASMTGGRLKCSTIIGEGAVLLGDASCAVLPTMGQGCNAGLESALVLAQVCLGRVRGKERQLGHEIHTYVGGFRIGKGGNGA